MKKNKIKNRNCKSIRKDSNHSASRHNHKLNSSSLHNPLLFISIIIFLLSILTTLSLFQITGNLIYGEVSLCINHPPEINSSELSNYTHSHNYLFYLDINASDADNDTIYFNHSTSAFNISPNGIISFTPGINLVGNNSFLISYYDNSTCPIFRNYTLNLEIINLGPALYQNFTNLSFPEDTAYTDIDMLEYFNDPENDTLYYSYLSDSHLSVSFNNSIATITPETDYYGLSWLIFIANDSLASTQSNNLSINITPSINYCGDGTCNAGEDCSGCPNDCGQCSSSPSGGGGGGASTEPKLELPVTEELTPICVPVINCNSWSPASCTKDQTQSRLCTITKTDCGIYLKTEYRNCPCNPNWECQDWSDCLNGKSNSYCRDLNDCIVDGKIYSKVCSSLEELQSSKSTPSKLLSKDTLQKMNNLFGNAVSSIKQSPSLKTILLVSLSIIVLFTLIFIWKYLHKHKFKSSSSVNSPNPLTDLDLASVKKEELQSSKIRSDRNTKSNWSEHLYNHYNYKYKINQKDGVYIFEKRKKN